MRGLAFRAEDAFCTHAWQTRKAVRKRSCGSGEFSSLRPYTLVTYTSIVCQTRKAVCKGVADLENWTSELDAAPAGAGSTYRNGYSLRCVRAWWLPKQGGAGLKIMRS
jgi:hypothetical protein